MSRNPDVKWAEREDKVYLTVLLPDAKDPKVNFDHDGKFTFSATAGTDNTLYEFELNLLDKVNVEECKINIAQRQICCILEKSEKKWWKNLLSNAQKTPHYVKVDWDKWADEDEDTAVTSADTDLGGMDLSKFGDMGGMMGGMGGMMGGMSGMDGMMGGMGGMMGGLGGMGQDFEDSDDEEIEKPEEKAADEAEGEASKDKAQTLPSS